MRLLLLAIPAWNALAQTDPDLLAVSGTVVQASGERIPVAEVGLIRARTAVTDSSGNFRFTQVATARHEIVASRDGFAPANLPLTVADHSPQPATITLQDRRSSGGDRHGNRRGGQYTPGRQPRHRDARPGQLNNLPIYDLDYIAMMSQFLDPGSVARGAVALVVNGMEQSNIGVTTSAIQQVKITPPPDCLERPNPAYSVYRQIESSGHLESDALEVTFGGSITPRFTGMIRYTLGRAYNDVPGNYPTSTRGSGINSFPANNYDLSGEWARADYDQRHRLNLLGTIDRAKYADFGVGLYANPGVPYTETTGRDNYHTGYANARPPGVPRNSLQGPGFLGLDLRWFDNFRVGKQKERPQAAAAVDALNALNHVNCDTYIGNLSSPFFGRVVSARPPRRMLMSFKLEF